MYFHLDRFAHFLDIREEIINILLNAKIPWNVNCLAQAAAIAALSDEAHLKKTRELIKGEKAFLMRELMQIKVFKVFPAAGV